MLFHKNPSGHPSSLILHKKEWNRLQKQAGPPEEPSHELNEHLQRLIEKSQAWMKTWPDTVQGCVAKKEKQKDKKQTDEKAAVEAFSRKEVDNHTAEVIEEAKQKIFDESCYGKKLLSALLESKTIEERDVQIQFMKEIKEKEADLEQKQLPTEQYCTFDLDKNQANTEDLQKCITVENSKENKEIYEKIKADAAKVKIQETAADLENARLMKSLLDREQETEDKMKLLEKQALHDYAAEYSKAKEERAKWEAEYYAAIEECHREQEKLNHNIKKVLQQINKSNQDPSIKKIVYENLEKCLEKEKKHYDFIEIRSKREDERADKKEQKATEKEIQDRHKRKSIAEMNKKMAEYVRDRECSNKCFCDRQYFIGKSERERNMKKKQAENEPEAIAERRPPAYFGPRNKLVSALKRREKEPSPFTGASSAHVQFAKIANGVLKDCKYKKPARKVVDEYRNNNGLNATTLPIPNY